MPNDYTYDIDWYIDDEKIQQFTNIDFMNLETAILKEHHWTSVKKIPYIVCQTYI